MVEVDFSAHSPQPLHHDYDHHDVDLPTYNYEKNFKLKNT